MKITDLKKIAYWVAMYTGIFVLVGIYRHNQLINLSSLEQKLHLHIQELNAEKNQLLSKRTTLHKPSLVADYAKKHLGFVPLKKSQIIPMT